MNDETEAAKPNEGEDELYAEAKEYVGKQKALISYLGVYVVVNAALVVIWALSGGGYPWFVWTLLGMAIPLFFIVLDLVSARYGKNWEERRIREYMDKRDSGTSP
ncbi:MAG: 2TM domain-containing protein [Acidimicrobiia bacterium]|nr:2TM domain-containing protein [Acidimicrobiia bacterium]